MTNEELKKLRMEYQRLQDVNGEVIKLIERRKELETHDDVAEYLNITNQLQSIDRGVLTDESILKQAIYKTNIKHTNKIYVCIAAYKDVPNHLQYIFGSRYGTDLDDPETKFKCYVDIEKSFNEGQILIPIEQCEGFEKNNNVLYSKDIDPMAFYHHVRNKFFKTCINESQEKAAEKLTIIKILTK